MNRWKHFGALRRGKYLIIIGLLAVSFLTGCASYQQTPNLYTGAGLGAALGAGLGAAINHSNPGRGAAIGGLLGLAGGGLAGAAYDKSQTPYQPQPYQGQPQGYYQGPPPGYDQQQPYYGPPPG